MNNRQKVLLGLCLLILMVLPVGIYIAQKNTDIRPKALTGQANFQLSTSSQNPAIGEEFDVLVTLQLSNQSLRVSGVDVSVLYDKAKVEAVSISPSTAAFTDAPILNKDDTVDDTLDPQYKRAHIVEVARKPNTQLPGGSIQIATIKFRAVASGAASIKFPDSLAGMEVVGISL